MHATNTALIRPGLAALALCATVLFAGNASAMPIGAPQTDRAATVEQARWVCGRFGHCGWRPNFYAYNYYGGPRFYHRPFFFHRPWGWHRWHRW